MECVHPPPQAGALSRFCPEIATAPAGSSRRASHLWGFCARRVSDARLRWAVTRAERVRPLAWHQAPACPPHVWANRYQSAKQQAHRTPANARLAPFANPRTPFTTHIRRAPSSRYRLEIATAPATFARPEAQPSARHTPEVPGGYELTGPRGARRPPARTQPRHAPAREPPPHRVHPSSVRGPLSCPPLKIATAPAGSSRPGAQPSARGPPAARGASSRDLEAPVAH